VRADGGARCKVGKLIPVSASRTRPSLWSRRSTMRPLRHLSIGPSGKALVEVTVRTLHSRFLLLPSTLVNATILGILARAQARYDIEICAYAFLANHGLCAAAHKPCYVEGGIMRRAWVPACGTWRSAW